MTTDRMTTDPKTIDPETTEEHVFHARPSAGVFCRPTCRSTLETAGEIERFASVRAALASGYRPCASCRPLETDDMPDAIRDLLADLARDPSLRLRDGDLRARGLDPAAVRRWFQHHHGLTFHAVQRGWRRTGMVHWLAREARESARELAPDDDDLQPFYETVREIAGAASKDRRSSEGDATVVHLSLAPTPLGPMLLGATETAVCLLEFTDRRMLETQLRRLVQRLGCAYEPAANGVARRLERELAGYFDGTLRDFETPLEVPGTDFQRRVWDELCTIPYGATRSYGEQARRIEAPRAVRAVARANGDNRIAIVIPCHRVIGADGSLTGYGGGLWRKEWLLRHEGVALAGSDDAHQAQLDFAVPTR